MRKTILTFAGKAKHLRDRTREALGYNVHFCKKCLKAGADVDMVETGDPVAPYICNECDVCEECGGDGVVEEYGDGDNFEWDVISVHECKSCNI